MPGAQIRQNVRDWIPVSDRCPALDLILHWSREGEVHNVGGNSRWRTCKWPAHRESASHQ